MRQNAVNKAVGPHKSRVYGNSDNAAAWGILVCLGTTVLISSLGMSVINVALPNLVTDFKTTLSIANWVIVAYLLSITTFVLSAGVLGDKFGKKKLLVIGMAIFISALVVAGLSFNIWMLIGARFLQGIGAAILLSQSFALVGTMLPKERTGEIIGLLGAMAATGTALGPVVGGVIIEWFTWVYLFWLMLPLCLISCLLYDFFLPNDDSDAVNHKKFDLEGTTLLCASLFLLALFLSTGNSLGSHVTTAYLSAFCFSVFLFIRSQKNKKDPLLSIALFRNSRRNAALAASFIVDATAMATLVVGPFFLTYVTGLSPSKVGLVMAVGPLIAALSGYPAGRLVDRYGHSKIILVGLCQISLGVTCFILFPVYFGVFGYIVALCVLTPGRQMFIAANSTYIIGSVTNTEKGLGSGLINLCKNLGLMTGASSSGMLFTLFLGTQNASTASVEQLNIAYMLTFSVALSVVVLSTVGIVFFKKQE